MTMNDAKRDELSQELEQLEQAMHDTEQFHTLEEQVADMKRRGIDPSKAYNDWDEKENDDWGDATWKANGKWEHKTPEDLDDKARENWDGVTGDANPPPIV